MAEESNGREKSPVRVKQEFKIEPRETTVVCFDNGIGEHIYLLTDTLTKE